MLFFEDRQPFATGSITYDYRGATDTETTPRILLKVAFEGFTTIAALDTGAPYVILDPQIADSLQLSPSAGEHQEGIRFRQVLWEGYLHRLSLDFIAEEGQSLTVEATVFIPVPKPHQEWKDFPSIIGLNSCLERVRFAVDPTNDTFYFGALP